MGSEIELQIKNPSKNADDFRVVVPATATVGDVKAKLQAEYPGNPDKSTITIIYAGRVLRQEDAPLSTFLQQNVDPSVPHTLHIVVKPSAPSPVPAPRSPASTSAAAAGPSTSASPAAPAAQQQPPYTPTSEPPPAGAGSSPPVFQFRAQRQAPATPVVQAGTAAGPSGGTNQAASAAAPDSAAGAASSTQARPAAAAEGLTAQQLPHVSAPIQGYAYTIPSPVAIYNPALSAAYTAALQALQAASPSATSAPAAAAAGGQAAAGMEGAPLAAFNAALQSLQAPAVAAAAAAAAGAGAGAAPAGVAGAGGQPAASEAAAEPAAGAGAAAGAAAGPALGLGVPPIALPMAQIAYMPALIPIPQPVLTAIPNPAFAAAAAAAGEVGPGAQQPEGQPQQHGLPGQPALVQGIPPLGQFIPVGQFPVGPMGQFPANPYMQAPQGMQVHVVEAVPGEPGGIRRRRVDVNQPGALPPEVVEALRAAQARGQLPGNLAAMVAQLQRQQAAAARRAERRARGFQIQINLGRVNLRAIMQLLFMLVIMAPYFSLRRLAMMLGIAALLNLARLEAVRRALNRMAGQLNLPLQQQAAAAGGPPGGPGQQQGAAGAVAGAPGAAAAAPLGAAGGEQQQQGPAVAGAGPGQRGAEGGEGAAAVGEQAVGDNAGGPAPAAAAGQQQPAGQPQRRPGILREVQALVVGFLTSLLPGFNVNPEDAAAFAAAEEMMRNEEAAAAAGGQ